MDIFCERCWLPCQKYQRNVEDTVELDAMPVVMKERMEAD